MTVDDALKIISQERLDVRGEAIAQGCTEQEAIDQTADIAAYVLHDAVLKDRKTMQILREQKMAALDEVIRLSELLREADPKWGSPMHLNKATAKLCYNRATKKIEKLVHGICVESFDPPEGCNE